MSTFNVRVTYKGEGDLNFYLPIIGEIKIWPGRDIFLEGATVEIIEALRNLRSIKVEHTLNGERKGCYRIIDVIEIQERKNGKFSPFTKTIRKEASSIADLRKELKAQKEQDEDEFIPVIEAGTPEATRDTTVLEAEITEPEIERIEKTEKEIEEIEEEVKKVEIPKKIEEYIVKVGKNKGKKIIGLDQRELTKLARYSTDTKEKEIAKELLDLLYSEE